MINFKKICGILLESVVKEKIECIVIGFGININDSSFDSDIEDKATSLFIETGKRIIKSRKDFIEELNEIANEMSNLNFDRNTIERINNSSNAYLIVDIISDLEEVE